METGSVYAPELLCVDSFLKTCIIYRYLCLKCKIKAVQQRKYGSARRCDEPLSLGALNAILGGRKHGSKLRFKHFLYIDKLLHGDDINS
jgi:hypothetical protein